MPAMEKHFDLTPARGSRKLKHLVERGEVVAEPMGSLDSGELLQLLPRREPQGPRKLQTGVQESARLVDAKDPHGGAAE